MTSADNIIIIKRKCPKCSLELSASVNLSEMDFENGLASVAIFHGEPPHSLLLYVDREGLVRGMEVIDLVISLGDKKQLTDEEISNFQQHIGVESMAIMYSAMITDTPLYVISVGETEKPAEFLRYFLKDYPEPINIVENQILNSFGISVIDSVFYANNKEEVDKGLIYDMSTGRYVGPWRFEHIRGIIKKTMKKGYRGLVERYTEAKRLKLLFEKIFKDVLGTEGKISLKEIKKKYDMSRKEAKYMYELLTMKKGRLKEKIVDDLGFLGDLLGSISPFSK